MDKVTKIRKGVEIQSTAIVVYTRAESCGKKPTEKGVIRTGKKLYRPPLPSTYKETEPLGGLNDVIE